jgi:hypothetical protein
MDELWWGWGVSRFQSVSETGSRNKLAAVSGDLFVLSGSVITKGGFAV